MRAGPEPADRIWVPAGTVNAIARAVRQTQARAFGTLLQLVVDQPRVAAQRDAAARGADVGFGVHRVLQIAHAVGRVGQRLDQRDAGVGLVGLGPAGTSTAMRSSIA